jgi:hypothetical protein
MRRSAWAPYRELVVSFYVASLFCMHGPNVDSPTFCLRQTTLNQRDYAERVSIRVSSRCLRVDISRCLQASGIAAAFRNGLDCIMLVI